MVETGKEYDGTKGFSLSCFLVSNISQLDVNEIQERYGKTA